MQCGTGIARMVPVVSLRERFLQAPFLVSHSHIVIAKVNTATRPILHLKRAPTSKHTFYLKRRFRKSGLLQASEFIRLVQGHAPNHGPETARAATHATLEALGLYLTPHQARRLTAKLPREFAESARRSAGRGGPDDLSGFCAQIARKTKLAPDDAMVCVRAVTRVLKQTVPEGELADAALNLPRELDELVA